MSESSALRREREPFGITYDRVRLDRVLTQLVRKRNLKLALELPAGGAKAAPGIYSLALARAGCHVHLFNPDPRALEVWERLGLRHMVDVVEGPDAADCGLEPEKYDLVWNFVAAGTRTDFDRVIAEMSRVSRHLVMTVHCNGYNWGYPWHRLLHRAFRLEWTHGETRWFFPDKVRAIYRDVGLEPIDFGLFDMPWWPDPPGFRDVRLHMNGGDIVEDFDWESPIEQIYATGRKPAALEVLSRIEDAPVPRPVRFVFSHLFYLLGERMLR